MSIVLIESKPSFSKDRNVEDKLLSLDVSEFFFDTIQGENFVGYPSAFLRLQGCTLSCNFCDTKSVWETGNPYSFEELFLLIEESSLLSKLKQGQHLVVTGGSPLRQQRKLVKFFDLFISRYGFKPYIEIENESTLMPSYELIKMVDCWNNSPKLRSSGNSFPERFHSAVLQKLSSLENSWFKFVVSSEEDWHEIVKYFLETSLILKEQIVLMPLGASRQELEKNREIVVKICVENSVRYSTREHIILWDQKLGV